MIKVESAGLQFIVKCFPPLTPFYDISNIWEQHYYQRYIFHKASFDPNKFYLFYLVLFHFEEIRFCSEPWISHVIFFSFRLVESDIPRNVHGNVFSNAFCIFLYRIWRVCRFEKGNFIHFEFTQSKQNLEKAVADFNCHEVFYKLGVF